MNKASWSFSPSKRFWLRWSNMLQLKTLTCKVSLSKSFSSFNRPRIKLSSQTWYNRTHKPWLKPISINYRPLYKMNRICRHLASMLRSSNNSFSISKISKWSSSKPLRRMRILNYKSKYKIIQSLIKQLNSYSNSKKSLAISNRCPTFSKKKVKHLISSSL